jgi:hypothetical protein
MLTQGGNHHFLFLPGPLRASARRTQMRAHLATNLDKAVVGSIHRPS